MKIRIHFLIGENGFNGLPGQKGDSGPAGKELENKLFIIYIFYFILLGFNGPPGINGK